MNFYYDYYCITSISHCNYNIKRWKNFRCNLADFSDSSSIIFLLISSNELDKITLKGNLHSSDHESRDTWREREKKKRLLFFVLPDLDDGSIRGITRTGTKQVSQLCFVRKLNTIFIAFLNCRIVHIVQTSVFFIKTCHTVLWSTVEK